MKNTKRYTVKYRRKREGKTNYKKRLNMLKSGKIRLTIRKSSNQIYAQLIEYNPEGDKILVSCNSKELEKYGWKKTGNNLPTSYLVGLLLGKKGLKKNIKEAILDSGFYGSVKGSKK